MSFIRRILKRLYEWIFFQQGGRAFNEQPTRPLDAVALARALSGEGRRHISTGSAQVSLKSSKGPREALYLLMAHSEGLHAVPDFGIVGLAASNDDGISEGDVSNDALTVFANQITKNAILDFLEVESFENSVPLQNMVAHAADVTAQVVAESNPDTAYSLTAGLIFAEIIIIAHHGDTGAYHIDRHHIERITALDWNGIDQVKTTDSQPGEQNLSTDRNKQPAKGYDSFTIYSRPVPRDGYILLCSSGLWRNVSERIIHDIVVMREDPQQSCDGLIAHVKEKGINQNVSVILLYFPPDFGPWR